MKMPGTQPRVKSCPLGVAALGVNNVILGDTAMANGAPTVVNVIAGQPDVARNLTVKGNEAGCAGNVTIVGTNIFGEVINEVIALAGVAVVVGNKAFKTVTQVTLPAYAVANTERVRVGTGAKLGLPAKLSRDTVLAAFIGGAREANRPTVAFSAAAAESNTATLSTALAGTAVIVDLYETP